MPAAPAAGGAGAGFGAGAAASGAGSSAGSGGSTTRQAIPNSPGRRSVSVTRLTTGGESSESPSPRAWSPRYVPSSAVREVSNEEKASRSGSDRYTVYSLGT